MTVGAGSAALNGWTVEFDASFNITSIWNAVIVSHVGNHYVVRNADWNGNVAGGKDTSFGFQATPGSGGTAASGFTINGAAVGTDPVPVVPTPVGGRRHGRGRQQRHARARLHRDAVGRGDEPGHGGLRHQQRHRDAPAATTRR